MNLQNDERSLDEQSATPDLTGRQRVLFVAWDGPGLTYLETLFVPIFARLSERGYAFDVLQFRWGEQGEEESARAACRAAGIGYRRIKVRRLAGGAGPMTTALAGGRHVEHAARASGSSLIMPRSTLPAVACITGRIARGWPLVFDADGLEVDERVEFDGLNQHGLAYRFLRDSEQRMVRTAAATLTRTPAASSILAARAGPGTTPEQFFVVANGRDPNQFKLFDAQARMAVRAQMGIPQDAPLIVYIGGTGHKYDTPAIGELTDALRELRPEARLLVMTGAPDKASAELRLAENSELAACTTIMRVRPEDAPRYLAAADVGTAFSRESFSIQGVSPIKVGEYLLCGVPVIGTACVGNNAEAVERGVYLNERSDMRRAARWIVDTVLAQRDNMREAARNCGVENYSLDRSVADYKRALDYATYIRTRR